MKGRVASLPVSTAIVLGLLISCLPIHAELCSVDRAPAATLLLPYFEVDLDDPSRANTVFTIRNVSAQPALVHLIFWTDWGAPTIDFDVFLSGYDSQRVDLSEVFVGNIPITADEANDPTDTISPAIAPSLDGSFPNCQNFFPFFTNPVIQGGALSRLVKGHTGSSVPSVGGNCLGQDHGDNIARGYITIDNVTACSLVLDPGNPSYFTDGATAAIASNVNQLVGEATYLESGRSHSVPLVGIEAEDEPDATSTASGYTFYGRYTQATGGDTREPLATRWTTRFDANPGTELVVWRDSTVDDVGASGFPCSDGPAWNPLGESEVVCFSQENQVDVVCDGDNCFPLATQRVAFGSGGLDPGFDSGRCVLNLNTDDGPLPGDVDFGAGGNLHQSYVFALERLPTTAAAGGATPLTHACDDVSVSLCGTVDTDGDGMPDDCDGVYDPLTLAKSGSLDLGGNGRADVGDTIDYTFLVENRGDLALHNVVVSDPTVDPVSCPSGNPIPTLAPGAMESCTGAYVLTQTDIDAGETGNTASADSDETDPVTGEALVTIPQAPALGFEKSGRFDETASPPVTAANAGDVVRYVFEITNSGNTTLTNVTIADAMVPMVECPSGHPIPALAPGITESCTGTYGVTLADLAAGAKDNTATADSAETAAVMDTASVVFSDDGDGVDATVEDLGPNGGDCNADGILDSLQASVSGLPSIEGSFLCLETTGLVGPSVRAPGEATPSGLMTVGSSGVSTSCANSNVRVLARSTLPPDGDMATSYVQVRSPLAFELECAAATATILYYGVDDLSNAVYRKLGPTPERSTEEWYTLSGVVFGTRVVGAETVATATLQLVDGEEGDHDLVANGRIVDPGGAARIAAGIPTLSGWMLLLVAALLGSAGLVVLRLRG